MLTQAMERVWELGEVNSIALAPETTIFAGAAVGDNGNGLARPLVAGDRFLGFCEAFASTQPLSLLLPTVPTGEQRVRVLVSGLVQLAVAGVKENAAGALVYASDDNSFTLSAGPNSPLGTVHRVVSEGLAIVAFGHHARAPLSSHRIIAAGQHKTTGGNPLEKIPLPGCRATDNVQISLSGVGKTPRSLQTGSAAVGALHAIFDGDPGADHLLQYVVYRAVA